MRVVAITNQKGGVGKTATTVNGARALAELGVRVLAIDLDPQGQTSEHVGMRQDEESPLYQVLVRGRSLESQVQASAYGFDLLAGGDDAAIVQVHLSAGGSRYALREHLLDAPPDRWDVVLLDCPPSLGDLVTSALIAADGILVPLVLQAAPYDGFHKLVKFAHRVRRYENPKLVLDAVFGTNSNLRTDLAVWIRDALEKEAPGALLEQVIRVDTQIAKAFQAKKPVLDFAPTSRGAEDYRALARALIDKGIACIRA